MEFLRKNKRLGAILLLGIVLRLIWVYAVDTQPIFDFKHYHDLAMSLLQQGEYSMPEGLDYIKQSTPYLQAGTAYPTAFRPPGYPLFLMVLYTVYPSILAAKLANVAMSVVWMLCMFWLGSKYFSRRAGLGAALLTAGFPPAIYYTSVVGTEIISVTLLLLVLCAQTSRVGGRWGNPLLIGAIVGFLALVKPYFAVFPAIYLVLNWWQSRDESAQFREWAKPALLSLLCAAGMMLLIISPWTIRNYVVFDRFVPISTNGSFVLYQNNNDLNEGKTMNVMTVPGSIFLTDRILNADGDYNEPDAMKLAKQEAMHWIRTHPQEYLLLGLKRLGQSYLTIGIESWGWSMATASPPPSEDQADALILGARASGLIVAGAGLVYALLILYFLVRLRSLNLLHKINLLFILFFTLIIFATEGQPRYMFPMYPFFLLGISWMADRLAGDLKYD